MGRGQQRPPGALPPLGGEEPLPRPGLSRLPRGRSGDGPLSDHCGPGARGQKRNLQNSHAHVRNDVLKVYYSTMRVPDHDAIKSSLSPRSLEHLRSIQGTYCSVQHSLLPHGRGRSLKPNFLPFFGGTVSSYGQCGHSRLVIAGTPIIAFSLSFVEKKIFETLAID